MTIRHVSGAHTNFRNPMTTPPGVLNNGITKRKEKYLKFRSRRWGSSLPVYARLAVRSSPHRHDRKFSGARVCRVTFKHLPQPLRSHSFGTLGQILKFSKKKLKNLKTPPRGPGGVSEFFWGLISPFFCENKPPVKFQNSN
jgi:hypothetical protein